MNQIQIGDKEVSNITNHLNLLSVKAQDSWKNRYPCGKTGGWIQVRILIKEDLNDVIQFITFLKTPNG